MFNLRPNRWLYAVYMTPALVGLRFAFVYQDATYSLIGAFMAASSFVMIGENAWSVAKRESPEPDQSLVPEAELKAAAIARAAQQEPVKPLVFVDGKRVSGFAYNQTLAPVKVDLERQFCQTLVDMKRGGFEMNISEKYWLKEGHWQGVPSEFIGMRNKFEYYHIFGKKGSATNSPYVVLNEGAVEKRAEGKLRLPLPQGM